MAAQTNVMNFLLQNCFGRSYFSAQFINLFQAQQTLLSRHSVLTFTVSVMLSFMEIKYEGKTESPFETHPKTMFAAVTSLILYCFSYDANLRISSSSHQLSSNSFVWVVRVGMALFGPLSLASLSSVLFPEQLCPFFLFSVSILFSLCELPCFKLFRIIRNWVKQVMRVLNLYPIELDHQGRRGGRRRRRPQPASPYLPRLSHTNELVEVDNLLV